MRMDQCLLLSNFFLKASLNEMGGMGRGMGFLFLFCTIRFSVAKATLQSQMSIRLSVRQSQKPLSLSETLLSTIQPINHQAYQP